MIEPPDDYQEIDLGMTNFDGSIDDGLDEALRTGKVFGRHAGWEFNGRGWVQDGQFHEAGSRDRCHVDTISGATLQELMEAREAEIRWKKHEDGAETPQDKLWDKGRQERRQG